MHYDTPPQELLDLINSTKEKYHPELEKNGVTIDALFALTDDNPLKCGGYPAMAFIKINPLRLRIKGMSDAEITIDKTIWDALKDEEKISLLDHELTHINVAVDKDGNTKLDDIGRPKLKMRRHDYQMGWFREVAVRHGEFSPEVYQAKILWRNDGSTFFPKEN